VTELAARLREAGELLRAVVESDDRMLISRRLLDVAHRLDNLRASEQPAAAEPAVVPIQSLAYDDDTGVVPIESLAPDQPPPPEAPAGIEASFRTFDLLIRERGTVAPSLHALLGQAAAPPKASSASVPALTARQEPEPVAIRTLVYRGQAALERAVAVRHQLAAELSRDASLESVQPLLQELLDLVPLALEQS
jgi:hypothetical protein